MGESEPLLADLIAHLLADYFGGRRAVRVFATGRADQVLRLARAMRFDLAVVTLNNELHATSRRSVIQTTTAKRCVRAPDRSLALVARLKDHSPSPVMMLTVDWRDGLEHHARTAGTDIILQLPSELEDFRGQLAVKLRRRH